MLKDIFSQLITKYSTSSADSLWQEIEKAYTGRNCYYHNLIHLENMYNELFSCKEDIEDWDTMLFALFYHDIVYNTTSKDNEAKSADLAVHRLTDIGFPKEKAKLCHTHILATKSHAVNNVCDSNLFTDADLSILGYTWDKYESYYNQIRKEYSYYPNLLYNPGRKKVLQHFLSMEHIFKTPYFREKYEEIARKNLAAEMITL